MLPGGRDPECTDSDGDGLMDAWETSGVDGIDLPGFGANPNHKDLFLELDVMAGEAPTRAGIQAMKAAFAAAPIDAGGVANPDGQPGINLWVDTGFLVDPTASEDGFPIGSCTDGIDNGGDGRADAFDTDCLVGDNLGGGNQIPTSNICGLGPEFFAAKAANFSAARARVFRYAISAKSCNDGSGGQGEIGGNDFVEYNHDGGTIMHEFGHTLHLQHGGNNGANCKPNYVSVMNYDNQSGIRQTGGGTILDYSPPRFPGGRGAGVVPLPSGSLKENDLSEFVTLDGTDPVNRFVFVNGNGDKVQAQLDSLPNWNGDTDPPREQHLTVNIDTVGKTGTPARCANTITDSTLGSHDDWSVIALPFRQFGDSGNSAINPTTTPEPPLIELRDLEDAVNTTDLSIVKAGSVDPAIAGGQLVYTVSVANHGPNPASRTEVVDALPMGLTWLVAPPECVVAAGNALSCELGELMPGESRTFEGTTVIAANLVYDADGPTTITNSSTVGNAAGPDSDVGNNESAVTTHVVALGDLAVIDFEFPSPPLEALVGEPLTVSLLKHVTNYGPSAPMDVRALLSVTAPADSSAAAVAPSFVAAGVGLSEARALEEQATIRCGNYGPHTFGFGNRIVPGRVGDTDPNLANNSAVALSLVVDCVVPVAINIHPGSTPNSINLHSTVPLAVLTTRVGEYNLPLAFDATRIDYATVRFGPRATIWGGLGGGREVHGRGHIEDSYELDERRRDGDRDMVLHFDATASGLAAGMTEACVKGEFLDATSARQKFFGCDAVRIVP